MRRLALSMIISVSCLLAQATARKTTTPPANTGYAVSPVVFKDDGCARDFVAATMAGGLAGRKQMAELVKYGCMERVTGIYRGVSVEQKKAPGSTLAIHRVSLVCAAACGGRMLIKEWVSDEDFHLAADPEIQAAIQRAVAHAEQPDGATPREGLSDVHSITHAVAYEVRASTGIASVTIRNAQGGTEQHIVNAPWKETFTAKAGAVLYLSAQSKAATGWVECTITVDGKVLQTAYSTDAHGIATVSGSIR